MRIWRFWIFLALPFNVIMLFRLGMPGAAFLVKHDTGEQCSAGGCSSPRIYCSSSRSCLYRLPLPPSPPPPLLFRRPPLLPLLLLRLPHLSPWIPNKDFYWHNLDFSPFRKIPKRLRKRHGGPPFVLLPFFFLISHSTHRLCGTDKNRRNRSWLHWGVLSLGGSLSA